MKLFFIFFLLTSPLPILIAQEYSDLSLSNDLSEDQMSELELWSEQELLIRHPSVSHNCSQLLKDRMDKQKIRLKLITLEQRTKKLLTKIPQNKATVRSNLESRYFQTKRMEKLTQLQIENLEEKLIRSGCPGLKN